MKKYRLTIQEQVSIWQNVTMLVEAESKEDILKSMRNGNFISDFDYEEVCQDTFWDTTENIEYDYGHILNENDIEEV